ncbi:MAG: hypothetical protein EOP11_27120 [Proteobacteria bacterium]|nr:MAG: hypothetical protein EOP11_27120 [Pseudomonadota bacterium]
MKRLWCFLGLALSACASVPAPPAAVLSNACGKEISRRRGADDGAHGRPRDMAFVRLCPMNVREAVAHGYREGFEGARRTRRLEIVRQELAAAPVVRLPASPTWACEVEAASKVFTGIGSSLSEAAGAAKDACGAHFQAHTCEQTECQQSL